MMLKKTFGFPVQIVSGYPPAAALLSGETDGGCWSWASLRATLAKQIEAGEVEIPIQFGLKPHRDLPKVPLAIKLAPSEADRLIIEFAISDPTAISFLYAFPPSTPKERVQVLRKAFMDTLKDSEFLAEAKKFRLDIDPLAGEEVEKITTQILTSPFELSEKLMKILK
jgi:tripartite-type tricarboxylate transporter receptor subunit TctC